MRGTEYSTAEEEAAEAIIAPPSSELSAPRKKRALIVWGAAHDAVLARIDASRRAQVGSQLWAGARAAAASILRQAGAGVGRKRAAEGPEDDDDARARVRQRASGAAVGTVRTATRYFSAPRYGDRLDRKPSPRCCLVRDRGRYPRARFPDH